MPTKEEVEAEERAKELAERLAKLAGRHKPKVEVKANEPMKPNDIVSPINDPRCVRWVHSVDASKGLIMVVDRRKDRSIVSAWLDQKLWQDAVIV